MAVHNLRHGRIRIQSGDSPPLEKIAEFSVGDLTFSDNFPTNVIRDRGRIRDLTAGDEEPVTWSFTMVLTDATILETVRDKIFDGFAETVTGLTTPGLNTNVQLGFAYKQGSLQFASTEPTGTKLTPPGTAPAAANEFSEELGVKDVEEVIRVPAGDGTPGSGGFNVFQAAADSDRSVVYDAVGNTTLTLDPTLPADCSGGRKTFKLILDIYDVCNPPDPADLAAGVVDYSFVIDNSYLLTDTLTEGDEFDTLAFTGSAITPRVLRVPGGAP